jgi:Zn-dependent protease
VNGQRGIDLFRIAGIQIAIDYSWLVIFALVLWSLSAGYFPHQYPGYRAAQYWGIGAVATFLFFASVLTHELSHAVVANRLGQPVRRITLFLFGGMAHLSREPRSPAVELKIAGVGPLTSLALGGLFWLVKGQLEHAGVEPLWVAAFTYLAIINVALAVFNMLPGLPLDGGRILRGVLWLRSGDLRSATAHASDGGRGIGLGLMGLGILQIFAGGLIGGLWLVFIGVFLRGAARASYYGVVLEQALGSATARDLMVADPVVIPGDLPVARAIEEYFLRYGYGGFPVGRGGRIEGLVSLPLVKRCPAEERAVRAVREVMRPLDDALRIAGAAPVSEALRRMVEHDSGRLLVMDGDTPIGLLTRTGITRFIRAKSELEDADD